MLRTSQKAQNRPSEDESGNSKCSNRQNMLTSAQLLYQ